MAQHNSSTDKIDELIRNTMEQAPELLQDIFVLEGKRCQPPLMCCHNTDRDVGANENFAALKTDSGKAAYLVHAIAFELYNADKSINASVILTLFRLAKAHC
jgi:hypothetical protein